jgi:hypothetical protein
MDNSLALAKIAEKFDKPNAKAVSTLSYLAKRVALVNGNGTLNFNLLENGNGPATGLEQFLNMNDAFVVTHWGLFLLNEVVAEPGQGQVQTYENETQFTTTGVVPKDLGKLYNGQFTVTIGQDKLIEGYPTRNFRVVNTTQQSSATTKSEVSPRDGFAESSPLVILSGSGKNSLVVTRPASATEGVQSTVSTNVIYAVLMAYGYKVFGGAYNI